MGLGVLLAIFRVLLCTVIPWEGESRDDMDLGNQEESDKILRFEVDDANINFGVKINGTLNIHTEVKHLDKEEKEESNKIK